MAARFRHLFLPGSPDIKPFTRPSSGGTKKRIPPRNRLEHSEYLMQRLNAAWREAETEQAVHHADRNGVYIEFKSDPGADLVTKSLEDLRSKQVRLLNVRTEGERDNPVTYATVYVAHEKKRHFLKKIEEYALQVTPEGGFYL